MSGEQKIRRALAPISENLEDSNIVFAKLEKANQRVLLLSVLPEKHPQYVELVKCLVNEAFVQDKFLRTWTVYIALNLWKNIIFSKSGGCGINFSFQYDFFW